MKITRADEIAGAPAPAEYFTGEVTIAPLRRAEGPDRATALRVRFAPGARTAWHAHPLGQMLIVTEGAGWAQVAGEPRQDIRAGDAVWIPSGLRHWHGATATAAMTHIAIQEALDGSSADWAEQVTDADYLG